ncbi:MAG: TonB-dependent receptor [Cellvibrionaceae bacterium]
MKNKHISMLVCASSAMVFSMVGQAQESGQARSILEEIVVTAERRAQNLQDVPLSITAFGDETRDRVGILSIQDMADFSPGLSYTTANDRPSIRGIGRQSNSFSIDSPVANYFDGVYTTSVQDAQRRPIFIDRTEILRGPQGALSGRGSIAGAINTWSKRPNEEFGGEIRAFGGNYARYGLEGTFTGSITDWLRARVNLASYHQDDGYFDNVATGKTEGDQPNNRQIADYLFDVDITENLDLFLAISFSEYDETRRSGGTTAPYVSDIQGAPASVFGYLGAPLTPNAYYGYFDQANSTQVGSFTENPVIVTGDKRKFSNNFQARQKLDDHHKYVAHLNWRTDLFDVKWIGGHSNYRYEQQVDGDGTAITSINIPIATSGFFRAVDPSAINTYTEEREWYSNEITLTSNSDGDFQWIVGVYQSNEDYVQTPFTLTHSGYDELLSPTYGASTLAYPGVTSIPAPIANVNGNASVYGELDGDTVSSAFFAQVDYQMSDSLKFTLGVRQNRDEKTVTEKTRYVANNVGFGPFLAGLSASTDVTPVRNPNLDPLPEGVVYDNNYPWLDPNGYRVRDLEADWTVTTGSFGVDYTPTDDALIYARLATGYRPGGFNAGFLAKIPQVDEETVKSFEVGYKGTIADQLQVSTSLFYYLFEDQQLPLPAFGRCTDENILDTCTVVSNFYNIPESENKGFEAELTWSPTENLSFLLTYGFLDAKVTEGLYEGSGFQNPLDPAAILPSANRYQPYNPLGTGVQNDTGYTNLPRWEQDISGNSLVNSPEHKFAFNTSYVFGFSAGDLTLSANYVWRDESYTDVFETKAGIIDSYGTVGFRTIWTDNEDRYTVILSGTNLTDEDAQDGGGLTRQATVASGAAGQAYYQTYNLIPPRQYTLELQYRFGG